MILEDVKARFDSGKAAGALEEVVKVYAERYPDLKEHLEETFGSWLELKMFIDLNWANGRLKKFWAGRWGGVTLTGYNVMEFALFQFIGWSYAGKGRGVDLEFKLI